MIFKNEIKRFVLEEVEREFNAGNFYEFAPFMDKLLSRNTPLKSTNLDRRLIHYWESRKLFNEVSENGYLSFFDICWLNLLQELKGLGVTPKTMEEVHNFFFGNNSFLEAMYNKSNIEELDLTSKEIINLLKREDLSKMLKSYGWNNFTLSILAILLTRKNTILHVSAGGKVAAISSRLTSSIRFCSRISESFAEPVMY